MHVKRTNIENQLEKLRAKKSTPENWKQQVHAVFTKEANKEAHILSKIQNNTIEVNAKINNLNFDLLDAHRIHHINHIKEIAIDYRLRFLNSTYYKGTLPQEALHKIKNMERIHQTVLNGFKIMAPSKLFKLKNADDPLLFVPMGNNYYYLIHKWGNDLHPFRKWLMWSFKNFENLILTVLFISIALTGLIPQGLFTNKPTTPSTFLLELFFMFKSVAAIVLFYGFSNGKNFSQAIWRSTYFNA